MLRVRYILYMGSYIRIEGLSFRSYVKVPFRQCDNLYARFITLLYLFGQLNSCPLKVLSVAHLACKFLHPLNET